ncbi:unnamed protein product [Soboliphyme baturini]|uniref:Folliculin n=1 Tax=Soboliphyme baturini TaxID=241478 RepID=A0A183J2R2_9BILA|nr:unnamed protein product [Soboliphyme baturini]
MDAVVGVCHFCEMHGPRVLFCCQPYRDETPPECCESRDEQPFYGNLECLRTMAGVNVVDSKATGTPIASSTNDDKQQTSSMTSSAAEKLSHQHQGTCKACQSMPSTKPGFLVNDHQNRISFVGSQYPYQAEVLDIVRQACLRSLSCEVCPSREGPIFFGDLQYGYCLCYTFTLKNFRARGFQHLYSLIIVTMDKLLLLNNFDFFVDSLKVIAENLQRKATKVFESERGQDQELNMTAMGRVALLPNGFFRERANSGSFSPRSLIDLTLDPEIFLKLNRCFVWLLRKQNERCVETLLEGLPCEDQVVEMESQNSVEPTNSASSFTRSEVNGSFSECCLDGLTSVTDGSGSGGGPKANIPEDCSYPLKMLRRVFGCLGADEFKSLLFHLLIGNQVIVKSDSERVTKLCLDGLSFLLPRGCCRTVYYSKRYLELWYCNLLGLVVSSKLPKNSVENSYALLEAKAVDSPSDGPLDFSLVSVKASLFTPHIDPPQLVRQYTSLISSADLTLPVVARTITAVKCEWMNKTKLYFIVLKQFSDNESCARLRWRSVTKCKIEDELLVKFWLAGLSRNFKNFVFSTCSHLQR